MADNSKPSNPNEALVLNAGENVYVIKRQALEQYRVTGEQKAWIERLLGQDVSGYKMEVPLPIPVPNASDPAITTPGGALLVTGTFVMLPIGFAGPITDTIFPDKPRVD